MRAKKILLALTITFSSLFKMAAAPVITQTVQNKSILFFSSGSPKTDSFQLQFRMLTKEIPSNYRLDFQFINYPATLSDRALEDFTAWYKKFLENTHYDVLIAGDPASLDFMRQNQKQFFSGIPIIALGLGRGPQYDAAIKMPEIRIIEVSPYIGENIKLINSLFPRRKKIVFLGNSNRQKPVLNAIIKKFDLQSEFKNLYGLTESQIAEYISGLDKCSLLFLPGPEDMNGSPLNSEQIIDVISKNTENPIFTCHDVGFNHGVLGGYFVPQKEIASAVGRVLSYMDNSRAFNASGVVSDLPTIYCFDVSQMARFKILKNSLNTKTVYINDDEAGAVQRNKFIAIVIISIFLLAALITVTLISFYSIKGQHQQINEERAKLNTVISQSDSLFWECYFDRPDDDIFLDEGSPEETEPQGDIAQGWIDSGIIPEEYLQKYNDTIAELKAGKETVFIDLPLLQEDIHTHLTNTRWKHVVYRIIEQKNGKVIKAMATAIDITTRKRAEEQYEGEMSYRAFVNEEYPAYTRLNLTSNVVMERMINVPELNHSMPDSTADNELDMFIRISTTDNQNPSLSAAMTRKELLTAFMNGTRSKDWDFYYMFSTGILQWYRLTVELASNPHTNCIEANIYMRDITNQKIMSISKDSVLDEEVEYIFWLDLSTSKCHFIHKAKNANWIPAEDEADYHNLVESMLNDVVSSKDHDAVENFFALKYLTIKLKDKQAANCQFEIITDNLRIAIKQTRSYYLNGNQNVILFICRDITDITLFEKLQNEKLTKAIEQAEKANASKSDFLSRMSHDLRTPMNGVIGIAELAEDELDNPTAIHEDLRKIKSSSKYMVGLLNDILDMAKIESGKLEIRKSRNSAGEIIEFICTQAKTLCDQHQINFYCNIDPAKYMNYFVNVDRLHMQQIVMNLLSNASKFTPEQGRIEFLLKQTKRIDNILGLEVTVSDTGSGMTKEFQKVMFEAFTQDVNSVNKQGTGLGLSIVNSLVHLMDGTITCDSAPGEGTKFTINLELEVLEEGVSTDSGKSEKKSDAIMDLTGKKILLVEDNPLNQEISRRILQKKGMEVTIAENGLVALNTFSESEPGSFDLVLMDVMMPVMGGIESAHLLRSIDRDDAKNIPIIALTANAFQEDIQKCLDAGMNTHLAKPIDPVLLIKTISTLLSEQMPVNA